MRGGRCSQRTDPQKQVAGWRSRLASPQTATALAVLVLLLAAAVIPLGVLARQNVLANATQLITGMPLCADGASTVGRAVSTAPDLAFLCGSAFLPGC
jgi:hypothetical protein